MAITELTVGESGARGILSLSYTRDAFSADVRAQMDELFISCRDSLRAAVKNFLAHKRDGELYKIFFELKAALSGEEVTISRSVKVVFGKEILLRNESNKRFLIVDNKCLKPLKNGKKQRFIPSRNSKKYKK